MKFLFLVWVSFLVSAQIFAQKQNIYFLKNDGSEVNLKDSADFIRIIQEPDSGSTNFKVLEFYPDDSRKFMGEVSSFNPVIIYEGPSMHFHKNGKKSEQISYLNGAPTGIAYYFYPNGRVKKVLDYIPDGTMEMPIYNQSGNYNILEYFDSTGVQSVKNGNGYATITDTEGIKREEGKYNEGKKDGAWKGFYIETDRSYEEVYKKGILISGVQTLADHSKLSYKQLREDPLFKGGGEQFHRFVGTNFVYPKDALERGISGKINIQFTIKTDGKIADIHVSPSLTRSIDLAAANVLQKSPKWTPAKFRGSPIDCSYEVPLTLGMSTNTTFK